PFSYPMRTFCASVRNSGKNFAKACIDWFASVLKFGVDTLATCSNFMPQYSKGLTCSLAPEPCVMFCRSGTGGSMTWLAQVVLFSAISLELPLINEFAGCARQPPAVTK